MSKIIMTKGLPASGKTTWANEYSHLVDQEGFPTTVLTKDEIRLEHPNWNESQVIVERDRLIYESINLYSQTDDYGIVIIADTNLNPIHEKRLRQIAESVNAEFEIKSFLHVPLDECIKRDFKRQEGRVGEKIIRQMHNQYIRPTLTIVQDTQLPFAVICDLDSTLALMDDRNPYDATDCEYDRLNEPVWNAVRKYIKDGYKLIIFSGRSSKYLEQTDRWLGKHGIHPDVFSMRKDGDTRKDYIVKKEMFEQHVKDRYYIEAVFDDREQVIDMYRDLGLTVFDVAGNKF